MTSLKLRTLKFSVSVGGFLMVSVVLSVEQVREEVNVTLSDPLLEQQNWQELTCWGKSCLVSITNRVLRLPDCPEKIELLQMIFDYAKFREYNLGFRLEDVCKEPEKKQ